MKLTRIVLMVAGTCSLLAANAMADGLVRLASDEIHYVTQETEPSPSDITPEPDLLSDAEEDGYGYYDPYTGDPWELFSETRRGLKIGGWFQLGYHTEGANGVGVGLPWDFPTGVGNAKVSPFNNYPNVLQLHQAWMYAEKVAESNGSGWDWGFRFDCVYGTDGQDTQAYGSEPGNWDTTWDAGGFYGLAIPQLYAEVTYNDLKVKAGKFFRTVGYQKVQAPENFFYSHALSFLIAPYTHTGFLAEYPIADCATLYGGWAAGWDTGFDHNGGDIFLGGFSVLLTDTISLTYMTTMGDYGFVLPGPGSDPDAYSHSIVLDWQVTDRLNYVLEADYLENGVLAPYGPVVAYNQYLFYTLNDRWAVGGRFDWFQVLGTDREFSDFTIGANYRPHPNLVIRPEIRVDVFDPDVGAQDSTVFGIDAILTY
ncbi:MAG: porin [Planctomycetes bacterium]|nr:porin [Planctomycetota bacterium]MBL7042201.1 porin [Pirellulaceae bacterium]